MCYLQKNQTKGKKFKILTQYSPNESVINQYLFFSETHFTLEDRTKSLFLSNLIFQV